MKVSSKAIGGTLLHLKARLFGKDPEQTYAGNEPPLRAELFSSVQMEQQGKTLANSHQLGLLRPADRLLTR